MSKVEAVRRALAEVGDVSNEELAAYIERSFGVVIRPEVVPVLKATVRDLGWTARRRREAVEAASRAAAAPEARPAQAG